MTRKELKEVYNRASILENILKADLTPDQWQRVCELIDCELLLEAECNK